VAQLRGDRRGGASSVHRVWLYAKVDIGPRDLLYLEKSLEASGLEVAVHPSYPSSARFPRIPASEAAKWADLIITVGGDGTLLKAYHEAGGSLPFLGVNCGSIGYLMEVPLPRFKEALELILAGDYRIEERIVGFISTERWSSEFVNDVVAVGLFDGVKRTLVVPADSRVESPTVRKFPGQVLAKLGENSVQVMSLEDYSTLEVSMPDDPDLRERIEPGVEVEVWEIMGRYKIVRTLKR